MMDCLLIGYHDMDFEQHVQMVKRFGVHTGAYRDLNLHFIEYRGKPYHAMDVLNLFSRDRPDKPFHNADFLWPVILYLGSFLAKHGFTFDYVNLFHLEQDRLKEKLLHVQILAVAITTTMYLTPQPILEIISFIRKYNQNVKIIVGGPYIMNQSRVLDRAALQELFTYLDADFYVINAEGELALTGILQALKSDRPFDGVANIAYRRDRHYAVTASAREDNALEQNAVDYSYFSKEDIQERLSLRTAKSCPFACAFCGFPERGGPYRYVDVDLIEKELDAIKKIGTVRSLSFIDDTLNVPKERFRAMLRMMIKNRYGFTWYAMYRCDHGDEDIIGLMKEAGCRVVFLGVESGNDDMLRRMNKTARRKDYLAAIPRLRKEGIFVHANCIVGFPGESLESARETAELIEEAKPNSFRMQLWYCDPITPIWEKREEYKLKGNAFSWSHATMDSDTACGLIEKMFLTIRNSVWLPQNGFEPWSVLYLMEKGMAIGQIETFLKHFNNMVKAKLLHPEQKIMEDGLLENLIKSCQFPVPNGLAGRMEP